MMVAVGTSPPPSPVAGNLYYHLVECRLYVFDGINWVVEMGRERPIAPVVSPHLYRVIACRVSLDDPMPHPAESWLNNSGLQEPYDYVARRLLVGSHTRLVIDFVFEAEADMFRLVWGGEAAHQP